MSVSVCVLCQLTSLAQVIAIAEGDAIAQGSEIAHLWRHERAVAVASLMLTDGAVVYTCQDRTVSRGAAIARALSLHTGELVWESARAVATRDPIHACVTSEGAVVCAFQTKLTVLVVRSTQQIAGS